MSFTNCYSLKRFSLFYKYFVYSDTKSYLADSILFKNGIKYIKYYKEFHQVDNDYAIITCRIKNKDEEAFIKSMEELKNNMLITGHTDYEKHCKEFRSLIINQIRERK